MHACIRPLFALALAGPAMFGATEALAASASALAIFDGISVRTDGSASLMFAGFEVLEASGTTTGGLADPLNDGTTFDGEFSADGEGLATNAGLAGATSLASASGFALSNAFTFLDAEMLLSGTGNVSIDISYTLDVDTLDNLASGYALAGIFASNSFAFDGIEITAPGAPGVGNGETLAGLLTLSFFVDVDPLTAAFSDTLFLHTYASAQAAPVPLPATAWLLGSALAGLGSMRRRVTSVR